MIEFIGVYDRIHRGLFSIAFPPIWALFNTETSSITSQMTNLILGQALGYIIFWSAVVILLITSGLLSYSLLRFQRKSTNELKTEQIFRDHTVLGIIWTLIPVGILVTLLILAFQTMQVTNP